MAGCGRHMVGKLFLASCLRGSNKVYSRTLLSSADTGLDVYLQVREKIAFQFRNVEEKFRVRIKQYLESSTESMIFTEDLKNMIHLANNNEEDLALCLDMLRRFNSQNKELQFGTFMFGPLVMRMFHYVERPDIALQVLNDKAFDGFFDQPSSFSILMDSLYRTGQYETVLEVFEKLQERELSGSSYPKEGALLALAACYKMNTKESYDHMLNIAQGARTSGSHILRKGVALAAALALKQNNPAVALELTSITTQMNYITILNIRLMALADLGHLEQVFGILISMLNQDGPETQKKDLSILPETMENIRAAVKRSDSKEFQMNLDLVEDALKQLNWANTEDLETVLCKEIVPRRELNFQRPENLKYGGGFDRESKNFGYQPRFPYRRDKYM